MQSIEPNARSPITPGGAPLVIPEPDLGSSTRAAIAASGEYDYRPGLPTSELVTEIRTLLATERRAERLVCRYLADLADRIQARQGVGLGVRDDEFDAARCFFGLGVRDTRERVRVGRALRELPQIERAFIAGELCYSRVREITRVATAPSEGAWLELACGLDLRSLERRVAAERDVTRATSDRHDERQADRHDERGVDQPPRTEWMGADRVRVVFELSTEAWTLLERAMREARRAGTAGPSDGDALEAVARAALSVQHARVCVLGEEATQSGSGAEPGPEPNASACVLGEEATQSGSSVEPTDQQTDHERIGLASVERASEPAVRLSRIMGRTRGWTIDALTEASKLSVSEVCRALTMLELGGRVRRCAFAFEPV